MNSEITLLILSTSRKPTRLTVSRISIFFITLIILAFFTVLGAGVFDYYKLRTRQSHTEIIKDEIEHKTAQIINQRKQIQQFSDEINLLKSKIIALNNFEKQVRIIANLNNTDAQTGLFGIGGSIPEDMEPGIDLAEKHSSLIREMHGQIDELNMASLVQQEGFEALLRELDEQKNLLASTPAIIPVKGIYTSRFGIRRSPFTGLNEFHKGVDIAAPEGTAVVASADGKVTLAENKGAFGNLMIINHGHGLITRYAHLSKFLKKPGDRVKRGDKIALIGNTGRSTGPHLHYEVRLNNVPVDPKKYILN